MKTRLLSILLCIAVIVAIPEVGKGQGMYAGTKEAPVPAGQGVVARIVQPKLLKLENTDIRVRLENYYYAGPVVEGGLVEPSEGAVQKVTLQGKELRLKNGDFSKGTLDTTDYGPIRIPFTSSPSIMRVSSARTCLCCGTGRSDWQHGKPQRQGNSTVA